MRWNWQSEQRQRRLARLRCVFSEIDWFILLSHCSIPFTPFPGKQGSKARHFFEVHDGGGACFPTVFTLTSLIYPQERTDVDDMYAKNLDKQKTQKAAYGGSVLFILSSCFASPLFVRHFVFLLSLTFKLVRVHACNTRHTTHLQHTPIVLTLIFISQSCEIFSLSLLCFLISFLISHNSQWQDMGMSHANTLGGQNCVKTLDDGKPW